MKFAHPELTEFINWETNAVNTLIIENQLLFRRILKDINDSIEGLKTSVILSIDDKPIEWSKHAEIITDFLKFNLNRKNLIGKICTALENKAVEPENYASTKEILLKIENAIETWSFDFSCNIITSKLSVSNLIKSVGIELCDDYEGEKGEAEKFIDYMELVREFDRDKLFITVNMRSYFSDETVDQFINTALSHEYKVLMVEGFSHPKLKNEFRLTIDKDLCEF